MAKETQLPALMGLPQHDGETASRAENTAGGVRSALATLLSLADAAVAAFMRAEETGESADAPARLLSQAEGRLHSLITILKKGPLTSASARAWLDELTEIQSFTQGAIGLDKRRNKDRSSQAQTALEALQAMVFTLDVAGWPEESGNEYRQRVFMVGKSLAADMVGQAIAMQHSDESELLAAHRRPGAAQVNFIAPYLRAIQSDPSLFDGFCAGVGGAMVAAGSAMYDADTIRGATYEECAGGPNIKSMYEDEESPHHEEGLTSWRAQVAQLVDKAASVMGATASGLDLGSGNGGFVRQLLWDARKVLNTRADLLKSGTADDYYGEAVLPAQAMVIGARDMTNAHKALGVMLEPALTALSQAEKILDSAGHKPDGPSTVLTTEPAPFKPRPAQVGWEADLSALLAEIDEKVVEALKLSKDEETHERLLCMARRLIETMYLKSEHEETGGDPGIPHRGDARAQAEADMLDLEALLIGASCAPMTPSGVEACIEQALMLQQGSEVYVSAARGLLTSDADAVRHSRECGGASMPVANSAAVFISRLCDHFMSAGKPLQARDLRAVHKAASVIMSALGDDSGLEPELEEALNAASVILVAQPPKSTGLEPVPDGRGAVEKSRVLEALAQNA